MKSTLQESLINNLMLQEVYFVLTMFKGLEEHKIPTALFQAISTLVYHNRPPLPLSEGDLKDKLIYPKRTLWHNKIDKIKMQLMKFYA